MSAQNLIDFDRQYLWHPYSTLYRPPPTWLVKSANGVHLTLADGRELVDGMASWWCAIHGYNHPVLNAALAAQTANMSHVMFGGLTHEPAIKLGQLLVEITPAGLENVFFCDSGSVSVEVAIKMALQYWQATGQPQKQQLLALRGGYHGDTFGAMAVCDPINGMHQLFNGVLPQHHFAERPACGFNEQCEEKHLNNIAQLLEKNHHQLAAVILEPIVQGAGGMWFYSPGYLHAVRKLCDEYDVLLIADEIATGFGRTGKLFACEHANISPDILCLGKALTGGYMTLAATLSTAKIAQTLSQNPPGVFMHGPTFMANPLACAVAAASVQLLLDSPWHQRIQHIEQQLKTELAPCKDLPSVKDVRVLGAIGVVEMQEEINQSALQAAFVEHGVWIRPFRNLVYLMPPYVIQAEELRQLTQAIYQALGGMELNGNHCPQAARKN